MPIARYGVFKGRPIARIYGEGQNPHYQIRVIDPLSEQRIAVNVKSKVEPSELLYAIDEDFQHPITAGLVKLKQGFTPLASEPGGLALDYLRGNLVDRRRMVVMPFADAGPGDDLYDRLDALVHRSIGDGEATIYAFGASWADEPSRDKYFGFTPGAGLHDVHMNQGNVGSFVKDDGIWQDGGLFFNYRRSDGAWQWIAVYLAFQSQAWRTDDATGHTVEGAPGEVGAVRLIAATLEPDAGCEGSSVTLLNTKATAAALTGWRLVTYDGRSIALEGSIDAGGVLIVSLAQRLSKAGDTLTLIDADGARVDGVSYGSKQAPKPGHTLVFRAR